MLRFSAVAMETIFESARGVTCLSPLRPLKDWTAPPGLNNDHCYVRTPTPSFSHPATSEAAVQSQLPLPTPPPATVSSVAVIFSQWTICSAFHEPIDSRPRVSQHKWRGGYFFCCFLFFIVKSFLLIVSTDWISVSILCQRAKRVSQIRIRRASPRETLLTPMGLPKVERLKKRVQSGGDLYEQELQFPLNQQES
ncbi:uncharacterized protein [Brachionichthys hirsutus]|uniref:uncharacterized protein isoform X1 n=1 Tax=Brachionichthys hirsutus TaxID=412623 RepID=UPI003604B09A